MPSEQGVFLSWNSESQQIHPPNMWGFLKPFSKLTAAWKKKKILSSPQTNAVVLPCFPPFKSRKGWQGPACGLENPGFELVLGPVTPCLEETEAGSLDLDTATPGPVRCLCQRASTLRGTWCQVFPGITQHSRPSGQTETIGAYSELGSCWRYSNKKAFSEKEWWIFSSLTTLVVGILK